MLKRHTLCGLLWQAGNFLVRVSAKDGGRVITVLTDAGRGSFEHHRLAQGPHPSNGYTVNGIALALATDPPRVATTLRDVVELLALATVDGMATVRLREAHLAQSEAWALGVAARAQQLHGEAHGEVVTEANGGAHEVREAHGPGGDPGQAGARGQLRGGDEGPGEGGGHQGLDTPYAPGSTGGFSSTTSNPRGAAWGPYSDWYAS